MGKNPNALRGKPVTLVDSAGIAQGQLHTPYHEQVTAQLTSTFVLRPTWGISDLREEPTVTGSATIDTFEGLARLQTGTTTGSTFDLRTREVGQYIPGGMGQFGCGIQIPTQPTGDGVIEWGYFGAENGFGFGYDATGLYVFVLRDSTKTITRPDDFTDGLPQAFDPSDGIITQITFSWYGFGSIEFHVQADFREGLSRQTMVHAFQPTGSSIIDPNQPICVRGDNGTGTQNVVAYIGGRQFATTRQGGLRSRRIVEPLRFTTTVGANNWQNILAIRQKATFNGRDNTVRSSFNQFRIAATDDVQFQWFFDATLTGLLDSDWSEATDYPTNETSTEFVNANVKAFSASGGIPFSHDFVLGGKANQRFGAVAETEDLALGSDGVLHLRVKPLVADCTVYVSVTIDEQW